MQRVHFQVWVGVFSCQQILTEISFVIFDISFVIFDISLIWDYALTDMFFYQSECKNCWLYIIIQKIALQADSEKCFQICFFSPKFGGKKWRRCEHAHASYPGLSFRPPGSSPYMGREERRVQGLDYSVTGFYTDVSPREFRPRSQGFLPLSSELSKNKRLPFFIRGLFLKSPETFRAYFGCHNSLYTFATPRFWAFKLRNPLGFSYIKNI